MRAVLAASLLVLIAPMTASAGETSYTAGDIVEHFVNATDLGAERGICIGTPEECGISEPQRSPAAFDLMVNFELNSAELSEQARANLAEFAKALQDPRLDEAEFAVEGHTDATGPEPFNRDLSQRRAEAVVSFLRQQGADVSQFEIRGLGESAPRSDDPFDPVNRRVETRLVQP